MGRSDSRIVEIRAQRLLAGWGRQAAPAVARRYLAEAERGGNPAAVLLAEAVLRAVAERLARPPQRV